MAICHFVMRARARTVSGGSSPRQTVDYLLREGKYRAETPRPRKAIDYLLRQSPATALRDDLRHTEMVNLPTWANGNARTFFEASDTYEGANRRWASTLQCSLPRELSRDQQIALARDIVRQVLPNKPTLWVLHEPVAQDGEPQPHIHCLYSDRLLDGIDRPAHQFFTRYNRTHPERGGAEKDPRMNLRRTPREMREQFAQVTNWHLEHARLEIRITAGLARTEEPTHEEELQATARLRAHALQQKAQQLQRNIHTLEAELRVLARLAGRDEGPRRGRLQVTLYEEDGYGR